MKLPVVRPPFEKEPNAKVFFKVPTGQFKVEKATRNKISIDEERSIDAWVAETGNKFFGQDAPGSNLTERDVRGYFLIEALPPGLRGSDRVEIELNTSSQPERLMLFFNETVTPLSGIVIASLGVPFRGYLQAIGGAG